MRIMIASDLHLEHMGTEREQAAVLNCFDPKLADVLVLAGDIASRKWLARSPRPYIDMQMKWFEEGNPLVRIEGNHEAYGDKFGSGQLSTLIERANGESVFVVAATGWFETLGDAEDRWEMNDFYQIGGIANRVLEQNRRDYEFIRAEVDAQRKYRSPNAKVVVVTHHFPFHESIARKYAHSRINKFFWSGPKSEEIAASVKADLWIHGHTHDSFDYVHPCGTRVVCNPKGYPLERTMLKQDPWKPIIVEI